MRRIILLCMLILASSGLRAQTDNKKTLIYNVFASSTYNLKTGQMIREVHQDYITVTKKSTRFYWGEQNYFYVYNESVNHDGFKTTTRYDFIDKYYQRGVMVLIEDRSADWSMRNLFMINYEGSDIAVMYNSNDPKVQ